MATNGTDLMAGYWLEEEAPRPVKVERAPAGKPAADAPEKQELALAPLVDKIAYGLARGLVVAMKELETHIASETRKVGDAVGRRFDTLQASFQELSGAVSEQRSLTVSVQEKCQELSVAAASLQEADARQAAELTALRSETKETSTAVSERLDGLRKDLETEQSGTSVRLDTLQTGLKDLTGALSEQRATGLAIQEKCQQLSAATASLQESDARHTSELAALQNQAAQFSISVNERLEGICRDLGVQQEDLSAVKSALGGFSTSVDTVVERLDRQAEALRSMYATYAQRETELEQLMDGLARLRAHPTPQAAPRL